MDEHALRLRVAEEGETSRALADQADHVRVTRAHVRALLLVINATERPLFFFLFFFSFHDGVLTQHVTTSGIDPRPRGRGLKSITRGRTSERAVRVEPGQGLRRESCNTAVFLPAEIEEPPLTLSKF